MADEFSPPPRMLFAGKSFCVLTRVPDRPALLEKIREHGGKVSPLESRSDMIIADHERPDAPENSFSYQYILKSVARGAPCHLADFNIGAMKTRARITTEPLKKGRTPFTKEDDKILIDRVHGQRYTAGNEIYKIIANEFPHHTWQAWRDRYLKRLRPTLDIVQSSPFRRSVSHVPNPHRHISMASSRDPSVQPDLPKASAPQDVLPATSRAIPIALTAAAYDSSPTKRPTRTTARALPPPNGALMVPPALARRESPSPKRRRISVTRDVYNGNAYQSSPSRRPVTTVTRVAQNESPTSPRAENANTSRGTSAANRPISTTTSAAPTVILARKQLDSSPVSLGSGSEAEQPEADAVSQVSVVDPQADFEDDYEEILVPQQREDGPDEEIVGPEEHDPSPLQPISKRRFESHYSHGRLKPNAGTAFKTPDSKKRQFFYHVSESDNYEHLHPPRDLDIVNNESPSINALRTRSRSGQAKKAVFTIKQEFLMEQAVMEHVKAGGHWEDVTVYQNIARQMKKHTWLVIKRHFAELVQLKKIDMDDWSLEPQDQAEAVAAHVTDTPVPGPRTQANNDGNPNANSETDSDEYFDNGNDANGNDPAIENNDDMEVPEDEELGEPEVADGEHEQVVEEPGPASTEKPHPGQDATNLSKPGDSQWVTRRTLAEIEEEIAGLRKFIEQGNPTKIRAIHLIQGCEVSILDMFRAVMKQCLPPRQVDWLTVAQHLGLDWVMANQDELVRALRGYWNQDGIFCLAYLQNMQNENEDDDMAIGSDSDMADSEEEPHEEIAPEKPAALDEPPAISDEDSASSESDIVYRSAKRRRPTDEVIPDTPGMSRRVDRVTSHASPFKQRRIGKEPETQDFGIDVSPSQQLLREVNINATQVSRDATEDLPSQAGDEGGSNFQPLFDGDDDDDEFDEPMRLSSPKPNRPVKRAAPQLRRFMRSQASAPESEAPLVQPQSSQLSGHLPKARRSLPTGFINPPKPGPSVPEPSKSSSPYRYAPSMTSGQVRNHGESSTRNAQSKQTSPTKQDSSRKARANGDSDPMVAFYNKWVNKGYAGPVVKAALFATTFHLGPETYMVMKNLKLGQGVPKNVPGVWTSADDSSLKQYDNPRMEYVDPHTVERGSEHHKIIRAYRNLVAKHGKQNVDLRKEFLQENHEFHERY